MPNREALDGSPPHYSHAVQRLNDNGGLFIGFSTHGTPDGGATLPTELIDRIPNGGIAIVEGLSTDGPMVTEPHLDYPPFLNAILRTVRQKVAVALPGGQSEKDIATLLRLAHDDDTEIGEEVLQRFEKAQQRREKRAVMGSLAWYLAYTDQYPLSATAGVPVAFWGRSHASSLPDMYDSVGVMPINTTDYHPPNERTRPPLIDPHAHIWSGESLQEEFARKLLIARTGVQGMSRPNQA